MGADPVKSSTPSYVSLCQIWLFYIKPCRH